MLEYNIMRLVVQFLKNLKRTSGVRFGSSFLGIASLSLLICPLLFCEVVEVRCHICNKEYKGNCGIGVHVVKTHKISVQTYYDRYLKTDPNEGVCPECGSPTKFRELGSRYDKYCSYKCVGRSDEVKAKRIEARKDYHPSKATREHLSKINMGHPGYNKDKHLAESTKELLRKANLGHEVTQATRDKIANALRGRPSPRKGKTNPPCSAEYREGCRLRAIKCIEDQRANGEPLKPRVGKKERPFLNCLESLIPYTIIRQYSVCGYFLDGYVEEVNVAVEFDEDRNHLSESVQKKDNQKQVDIISRLHCVYLRVRDREWESNPTGVEKHFLQLVKN